MKLNKLTIAVSVLTVAVTAGAAVPLYKARQNAERFEKLPVAWPRTKQQKTDSGESLVAPRRTSAPEKKEILRSDAERLGVYGYITNSDYWDFVPQWVELTKDGYNELWDDADYWMQGEVKLDTGWVRNGKICGYATQLQFGQYLTGYFYKEYDMETGVSTSVDIDYNTKNVMYIAAYSPEEDLILGFGTDPDGAPYLMTADGSNASEVRTSYAIRADDRGKMLMSLTWNDAEKCFVGVNYDNQLVSVSPDGTYKTIMNSTGVSGYNLYYTGLCYDATERVYYWNVFDDYYGYIYRIDSSAGTATQVSRLNNCEIFAMLYCPAKVVDVNAPGRPSVESIEFEGASATGTVTFRMPVQHSDGSPMSGELSWTATLDDGVYSRGKADAGTSVSVSYENLSTGTHSFGCYATVNDAEGPEVMTERYVGNDTPKAPANIVLSAEKVSWQKVKEGVHGGFVDADAIVYTVYIDGESVGTTSDTSLDVTIDGSGSLSAHQASVTATFDGRTSEAGLSNKFVYGSALELPVYFKPTEEEFLLMTTTDNDGDGYGWQYIGDKLDADYPCLDSDYSHDENRDADDWLFLPAMVFDDADAFYILSFEAKGRLTQMSPEEFFEVRIGREPNADAMVQTIVEETRGRVAFSDYERYFRVPEAGEYYIGIHATSDPMMFGVRVRNIQVEKSAVVAESPNIVVDASAVPGENGDLSATVSFVMPRRDVMGNPFEANLLLTATVTGNDVVTLIGNPGELVSGTVRTRQGENRLRIVVNNGEAVGLPYELNVYTGVDVPLAPPSVKAETSADNYDLTLDWVAPTEGEHNGYLDPDHISYTIHTYNNMFGWMPLEILGEAVTHYQFRSDLESGMAYVRLGVSAETIAGSSKLLTAVGAVLGTPYDAPLEESFDAPQGAVIGPWTSSGSPQCQWGFADLKNISYDWENLSGGAMVGIPQAAGISSGIVFPKFSTLHNTGSHIVVRVWNGGGAPSRMTLFGTTYGIEENLQLIACNRTGDWYDLECYLPSTLRNREWVQIQLVADFNSKDQLCVIDNFKVDNQSEVATVDADHGNVVATRGAIEFINCEGMKAVVNRLDGTVVARFALTSDLEKVTVEPGIYVVKTGEKRYKLSVR